MIMEPRGGRGGGLKAVEGVILGQCESVYRAAVKMVVIA